MINFNLPQTILLVEWNKKKIKKLKIKKWFNNNKNYFNIFYK